MPAPATVASPPMRLRAALAALRQLIANPEDTQRVFEVIRAMAGPALARGLRRFRQTEAGQRMLKERRNLLRTLRDREALAGLPDGSLGRAYHKFVYAERLTADELVAASTEGDPHAYDFDDRDLAWYGERVRDQHDLWHVVTQYGRDPLGEACLLAFTWAQTRNRGVALIAVAAAWKLSRALGFGALRAMWQGLQAGRHASWLPAQEWEALLRLPVVEVRRLLGVASPSAYGEMAKSTRLATG